MRLTLVLACTFLAAAFYTSSKHSPPNLTGVIGFAIALILCEIDFIIERQKRLRNDFYDWLFKNSHAVHLGGATYKEHLITLETEITQYQAVLSFLLVTLKAPSRVYFIGHESGQIIASLFTLISLLFGWWAVPLGPVHTIRAVSKNMRGGFRQTIGDVFDQIRAAIPSEV